MTDRTIGEPALPNLFVIGAAKSGTTSLHRYLGLHPELAMSTVKEPQAFAASGFPASLAAYEGCFPAEARLRGESSAVYSQWPRWPGVPKRIRERVPGARFIYLVRDPIDRVVSHYHQHVVHGKESRSLSEALTNAEREDSPYVCPSRYATQVHRYLEHFDASRVMVIDAGRLALERERTLSEIFAFLGVDPAFRSPGFRESFNRTPDQRSPNRLGKHAGSWGLGRAAARAGVPLGARRVLRGLLTRGTRPSVLADRDRLRLAEILRPEAESLRELTGQSFERWSV